MQKILIYGAGVGGERLLKEMYSNSEPYEFVAFVDKRIGGTVKEEGIVIFPEDIAKHDFDIIFVATLDNSVSETLVQQYNVPAKKINYSRYFNSVEISVRIRALERFKDLCDIYDVKGSAAEVGVYQGDFAKHINRLFSKSRLYLYDTFEGFDKKDIDCEENKHFVKTYRHYSNTTVDLVMGKMPNPKNVVIRKGFFPETAIVVKDEAFAFVSLDADLYGPTYEGLCYFYPKLTGGVLFLYMIIMHGTSRVSRKLSVSLCIIRKSLYPLLAISVQFQ
jgi:O-methyltransferase